MFFVWDVYFSLHLIVEESRRQPFPSPLLSPAVVVESLQIVTRLCVERKMWLENGDVAGSSLKRCFLKQPIYSYLYIIYLIALSSYEECVATKVCPHCMVMMMPMASLYLGLETSMAR